MLDIHSHILPGVDDGSDSLKESLTILKGLEELGFSKIVLTPHIDLSRNKSDLEAIQNSYSSLIEEASKNNISCNLSLGSELVLCPELLETETKKPYVFELENKNFQLVELHPFLHPAAIDSYIDYSLKNNIVPVIAHIERVKNISSNKNKIKELKDKGLRFQVDLISFSSFAEPLFKKLAQKLLESDLIDYLASDCHSLKDLKSIAEGLNYVQNKRIDWKKHFTV